MNAGLLNSSPTTSAIGGRNLVSIARPYFGMIVVSTILLCAWGIVAMLHMPSGIYPEVSFPEIAIIVETPGLGVRDVEISVTRPIEERVSVVTGVNLVRSKTVRGASEIKVDFAPGADMVQSLNDIRAKMAEIEATLPLGTSTLVERQSPSIYPIISVVIKGGTTLAALHDYGQYDLRPRISRLDDVSYVSVEGGDSREILVEVDPQRLIETGLSITDLADRISKDYQLKAVGRLIAARRNFKFSRIVKRSICRIWPVVLSPSRMTSQFAFPMSLGSSSRTKIVSSLFDQLATMPLH
jgi:multidrug efflux pump subunit AcrB